MLLCFMVSPRCACSCKGALRLASLITKHFESIQIKLPVQIHMLNMLKVLHKSEGDIAKSYIALII